MLKVASWLVRLMVAVWSLAVCQIGHAQSLASTTPGAWSYTVPANVYAVRVTLNGAGGGGGGADSGGPGGNGGSGASIVVIISVTPGQVVSGIVGGGGGTGFTGGSGFNVACTGAGSAPTFGGAGAGANSGCAPAGGYSGGGGAGGGASTVSYGGIILAQAGAGGGGSGGGWNNQGIIGISASATITQTALCNTLGTGAAGVSLNVDGGAAGGGGGGVPGGAAGLGSQDNGSNLAANIGKATTGGTAIGGGAGGSCYSTSSAVISAIANGTGGAGAAGQAGTSTTASAAGGNGSVTVSPYSSLSVTKISTVVTDPINGTTNPKFIPGATVRYCITVTNNGPSQVNGVGVSDPLPTAVTYVAGTLFTGTSCGAATTLQSDPSPATIITSNAGTMANGATYAVAFNARVN